MTKDNCLVIPIGQGLELLHYQMEMLHYNPQPGIIPVQKKTTNQEISLHYQVGSRQALTEYLQYGASQSIVFVLIKIVDILQDSKNLFLNPASFKLVPSYIYLDPDSGDVALLYQPFEPSLGIQESLISFIESLNQALPSLAVDKMAMQQIYQYLEQDYTNLANYKKYLTQLSLLGPVRQTAGQKKPFRLEKEKKYLAEKREKGNINLKENKEKKEEIINIKSKRTQLISFLLVQILIAVLLYGCSNYLNSLGNPTVIYVGVALLLGGTNIVLLRRLFTPGLTEVQRAGDGTKSANPNIVNRGIAFRFRDSSKE